MRASVVSQPLPPSLSGFGEGTEADEAVRYNKPPPLKIVFAPVGVAGADAISRSVTSRRRCAHQRVEEREAVYDERGVQIARRVDFILVGDAFAWRGGQTTNARSRPFGGERLEVADAARVRDVRAEGEGPSMATWYG